MSGSARLLILYDNACRALAEARSVDEVKDVRDQAIAMAAYARQARNRDLEADAIEIRLRATRRLDQLRQAQKATVGLNEGGRPTKTGVSDTPVLPTLASQGIDKNLAKQGRVLGALSDEQFESVVASARDAATRVVKTVVRGLDIVQLRKESYDPSGDTVAELRVVAGQRFNVIYADPPWPFEVYSVKGKQRSAERHYDTMSLEEIKALPIADLAADDCALFLWVVNPQLPGALDIIRSWVSSTRRSPSPGLSRTGVAMVYSWASATGHALTRNPAYWQREARRRAWPKTCIRSLWRRWRSIAVSRMRSAPESSGLCPALISSSLRAVPLRGGRPGETRLPSSTSHMSTETIKQTMPG